VTFRFRKFDELIRCSALRGERRVGSVLLVGGLGKRVQADAPALLGHLVVLAHHGDAGALARLPGELPEEAGDLAIGGVEGADGRRDLLPVFGGSEEPELVLGERSADARGDVGELELGFGVVALRGVVGSPLLGLVVDLEAAVDLVSARLGDAVDDAAGVGAVLGVGAESADLDLVHPLDTREHPVSAAAGIGDVHAVDRVGVLAGVRASVGEDGAAAAVPVEVDARSRLDDGVVVPGKGSLLEELLAEVVGDLVGDDADEGRLSGDGDLGLYRLEAQGQVDDERLSEADPNVGWNLAEALELRPTR
jgi:hypothetical protein